MSFARSQESDSGSFCCLYLGIAVGVRVGTYYDSPHFYGTNDPIRAWEIHDEGEYINGTSKISNVEFDYLRAARTPSLFVV